MEQHHHDHHHHEITSLNKAFIIGITLNLAFVVAEFAAGFWYNSLGLLSDAGHNLGDVASLVLAMLAFRLAKVHPTASYTYGYKKSTILVSLLNAVILLVAVGIIIAESITKLLHPRPVEGDAIAWVAGIGVVINAVTAWLFMKDKDKDLNVKGAYLHMAADALVSVGVVISGIVIAHTGWYIIDPVIGLVIALVIIYSTWGLLRDSLRLSLDGVPNGHEFTSLLLALLNSDGKGKNIPDESICNRVKALNGPVKLTTYVSLTCTNCPDVVQALNAMATLNPEITHEMVDGAINQEEVEAMKVQGVPSVFADGKLIHVGRGDFGELLGKLEAQYGVKETDLPVVEKNYDVIIVGGGPAGSAAAIYTVRKGLKVAIVADRIGGQVKETVGIENMISVPQTTGQQLALDLMSHMKDYPIDILEHRRVENVTIEGRDKILTTSTGEKLIAPAVIVATGASWRRLNIPGEAEYIGRGVAFCPHCDGPFYKGKHVAVVGGGNSGIEAAIDLAGICSKVTVLEFADTLKADQVLQDKLRSLPNVEIFMNSQTMEVLGNGEKVNGIRVKDRQTDEVRTIELDGIFVQIGLAANSGAFREVVDTNRPGEIVIDNHCRTSVPGIYAAGDVSTVPYKQIIISMGEGAKAALTAFEDRMRGML